MVEYPIPINGFCAFSGTGKTTLLRQLIPRLKAAGLRVAVIKHAHHRFDIDTPGKDSFELRKAGAERMVISSARQLVYIRDYETPRDDANLADTLTLLQPEDLDLVLVEGFKHESFPKIELHRPSLGKPLIYPNDTHVIAIATDAPLPSTESRQLPKLDLNKPQTIA